jgi:Zn finger protein HypA/HybF involved in hydrogenase expression
MKQLSKIGKRRCHKCKKVFDLDFNNFYHNKNQPFGFAYECRRCHSRFSRRKKIREFFIKENNFTCKHCGLHRPNNFWFFDIDHIIALKRTTNGLKRNCDLSFSEKNKIQILCPNCHRIKTFNNKDNSGRSS